MPLGTAPNDLVHCATGRNKSPCHFVGRRLVQGSGLHLHTVDLSHLMQVASVQEPSRNVSGLKGSRSVGE